MNIYLCLKYFFMINMCTCANNSSEFDPIDKLKIKNAHYRTIYDSNISIINKHDYDKKFATKNKLNQAIYYHDLQIKKISKKNIDLQDLIKKNKSEIKNLQNKQK